MEFIRCEDKSFAVGVKRDAQIGYRYVEPMVHNPLLSQLIAGLGLFVVALIVLTILTSIIARYVRMSALSPIDRTLGFIFGVLRGAFVVCLAFLLLDASVQPNDRPAWIREAKSAPYLHDGSAASLEDVIALYEKGGIDRPSRSPDIKPLSLTTTDKSDLIAFLNTR